MATTRKTVKKKKTAGKQAESTAAKASRGLSGSRIQKDKLALLECLDSLGLLDTRASDALGEKAEALAESKVSQLPVAASGFDRALTASLGEFEASGADANLKSVYPALVAWQNLVTQQPGTRAGLQAALAGLHKVIPLSGASLFVRNPDQSSVESVASVGFEVELIQRIRFDEGSGFSAWVASRKKPVLYASIHRNEAPDPDRIRSFMSVPLVVGDECIGVVNVGHAQENTYSPTTLRRLILCGSMLAALVQRFVSLTQISIREIRSPETGLATRHYLRSRLDEEVVRCRELGHSMSLIVLQLNELESYVGQFGDEYRERCLQDLSGQVSAWARPTEIVGHGDGDRLVVILPAARRDQAEDRAGELAQLLEKHAFPRRKRMTAGLGLASYPGDAEEPQELLSHADKMLGEMHRSPGDRSGVYQTLALS